MSKRLVKILCICAVAVLLPLIAVGVALSVTEPVMCTLKVEESGKTGNFVSSSVSIRVEGKEVEGKEVEVKKHSEITLVFKGEGYDFDGWFKGSADEIKTDDNAVEEETSYTFLIRGNSTFTAVRNVIEYQITYTGFLDDGVTSVSTQIDELQQTVEYGQTLASLTSVSGATWGGWYEAQSQGETVDATGTKVAKFLGREVELKPVWSNQMTITYRDGDTIIATQRVSEEGALTHALLNAESDAVKNAVSRGKRFSGWKNESGEDVTSVIFDKNGYVLYLQEETIGYTLNVKYNEVSNENPSTISYNIDQGFTSYTLASQRPGYTFKGLKLGEDVYYQNGNEFVSTSSSKLSDQILNGTSTEIDVVAVWECDYSVMALQISCVSEFEDAEHGDGYWGVYGTLNGQDDVAMRELGHIVKFEDKEGSEYRDLNQDIYEYYIGGYTNLHRHTGEEVEFAGIATIYINNEGSPIANYLVSDDEPLTFKRVLDSIVADRGSLEEVERLSIKFIFDLPKA